jgi:hypothetical protein
MPEAEAEELCSIEPDRFEAFNEDPRAQKESKAAKEAEEKASKDRAADDAKTAARKTAASRTRAVTESD